MGELFPVLFAYAEIELSQKIIFVLDHASGCR